RVRLDDRAKICDLSPDVPPNEGPVLASCSDAKCGGAEGRWLFHCHILHHGALGMIGELTVLPGVDTQPPQVTCSVATASLWPPDHRLVNIGLIVPATDNCTDAVPVDVQVFSDESEEAPTGDGHFSPDAKDIAPSTLRVRSERNAGGDGRVSLIVTTATDTAGNQAHCCSTVV